MTEEDCGPYMFLNLRDNSNDLIVVDQLPIVTTAKIRLLLLS